MADRTDGLPHPSGMVDTYLAKILDENRAFHKEALSLLRGDRPSPDLRTADDVQVLREPAPPASEIGEEFREFVPTTRNADGTFDLVEVKGSKAKKGKAKVGV